MESRRCKVIDGLGRNNSRTRSVSTLLKCIQEVVGESMRKLALVVVALAAILSFQNCAKQGFEAAMNGQLPGAGLGQDTQIDQGSNSSGGSTGKTSVEEVGSLKATDLRFIETSEVALASDLSQLVDLTAAEATTARATYARVRMIVDLSASQLNFVDYNNNLVKKYCLPTTVLASLKGLIEGAKLCKTVVSGDAVCTQVMKPAHTFLHHLSGAKIDRLGEATNGCGQGQVEFCGTLAAEFQNFWNSLKAARSQYVCK